MDKKRCTKHLGFTNKLALILVVLLGAIMYVTAKLKTYSINADKTDDINKTSVTDNSNKS